MTESTAASRSAEIERRQRIGSVVRVVVRTAIIVGLLTLTYYVLPLREVSPGEAAVRLAIGVAVSVATVAWEIRAVAKAEPPPLRAVEALGTIATLLVMLFAATYLTLSWSDSAAFTEPLGHTSALYFTITTLATVGYGDIAPRSDAARVAAMIQMIVNVAVLSVAIRLIFRAATSRRRSSTEGEP